ncbi:MAG: shikimate kinase, partial [Clostridia bacterium]|nr:shikimate kinase [Clostridia bacterium]
YLIGMMSCGKTTLGKELAKISGRKFLDADKYIEEREGRSIPQMFAEGEEVFRAAERRAMLDIANMNNVVVATGGGAVLSEINRDAMRMSGTVIYVDRSVEKIVSHVDCGGRPLLAGGAERLYEIYGARKHLYESCAHFIIKNNEGVQQGLYAIREALNEN